jgi:hypothetical protein
LHANVHECAFLRFVSPLSPALLLTYPSCCFLGLPTNTTPPTHTHPPTHPTTHSVDVLWCERCIRQPAWRR